MNATCERKAQRAREVLQLWKVMEFADQAATPSTRRPKDRKSSDKSHHDGSCGVNLTDPGTLSDALKSRMRLTEQECLSTITVTVGAVSREACINLLERCVSSGGRAASQERPERNPARIGLAELTISAEGALFEDEDGLVPAASFRLSPLLWLAAETSRSESAGLFQARNCALDGRPPTTRLAALLPSTPTFFATNEGPSRWRGWPASSTKSSGFSTTRFPSTSIPRLAAKRASLRRKPPSRR